jgi:hypothetical protein
VGRSVPAGSTAVITFQGTGRARDRPRWWSSVAAGTRASLVVHQRQDHHARPEYGTAAQVAAAPDGAAPVTSFSQAPLANAAGWNGVAVTVTLDATDLAGKVQSKVGYRTLTVK